MAITASLVFAGHNSLRYFITADTGLGEGVNITSSGAATPDIQTDSLGGALKAISKANASGYGKLAAGSQSIANTRALLLGDSSATLVGAGNNPPCAISRIVGARTDSDFIVDAKVDGTYALTVTAWGSPGSCYLDVFVPGAIGT